MRCLPIATRSPVLRVGVACAVSLWLAAFGAQAQERNRVVLVSVDGLRPDLVLEPERYGVKLPNLRALVRDGAHAQCVTGVLPTVTYPSHTTMVTGVAPAAHGVPVNQPFDPLVQNLEGWYWYAEEIRVPTLWDVAAAAGLVTANVDWPVTVGARITHNLPQYWRAGLPEDAKLRRLLATDGLLREAETAVGAPYPPGKDYTLDDDRARARFSEWLIGAKRPHLHLAYFSAYDTDAHEYGPFHPRAKATLEAIDGLVGQLRTAAERAAPGRTTFAVVSDHGFVLTDRIVQPNVLLREAGLIETEIKPETTIARVKAWRAAAQPEGGTVAFMLKDAADAEARRRVLDIVESLRRGTDPPFAAVLDAAAARSAGGYEGALLVAVLSTGWRVGGDFLGAAVRLGPVRGTHGYLPSNPEMDASFFVVGPGIAPGRALGRIDMRDIAPTLAARLGIVLPKAEGRDVLAGTLRR